MKDGVHRSVEKDVLRDVVQDEAELPVPHVHVGRDPACRDVQPGKRKGGVEGARVNVGEVECWRPQVGADEHGVPVADVVNSFSIENNFTGSNPDQTKQGKQ